MSHEFWFRCWSGVTVQFVPGGALGITLPGLYMVLVSEFIWVTAFSVVLTQSWQWGGWKLLTASEMVENTWNFGLDTGHSNRCEGDSATRGLI